jgi:hypothetical protein
VLQPAVAVAAGVSKPLLLGLRSAFCVLSSFTLLIASRTGKICAAWNVVGYINKGQTMLGKVPPGLGFIRKTHILLGWAAWLLEMLPKEG